MASKAGQPEADKVDIEEALDYVDKTLDRTKVLYEQYFLGMQKQPPSQIHTDVERRLRDLQQMQIRNTGLRYRFATLQQKFGSYNSYWRRTLRQIENGTYIRNLQKISRQAATSGEAIPEEILAAMPKRMREQVKRDREQALAIAKRRNDTQSDGMEFGDDDLGPVIGEAPEVKRQLPRGGAQVLSEDDGDLDFEAFFASVEKGDDTQENAPAYQEPVAVTPRVAPTPVRPSQPVLSKDDDEATSFEPPPRATQPVPMQSRGTGAVPSRPSQPAMPSGTRPPIAGGPQHPRGVTQPGTPTPGPRPGPPPLPSRATGPVPALRSSGPISTPTGSMPLDQTEAIPTLQTGAIPTLGQAASMPTRASQSMQTQPMRTHPGPTQPMRTAQSVPTDVQQTTERMPADVQQTTERMPTDAQQTTERMPMDAHRMTQPIPPQPPQRPTPMPSRAAGPVPLVPSPAGSAMDRARTGPVPVVQPAGAPGHRPTGPVPAVPPAGAPGHRPTGPVPAVPPAGARPAAPGPNPIPPMAVPTIPRPGAPSQVSKPNPIAPGSSTARPAVPVETMSGPFPRAAAPPVNARPEPPKVAPPRPHAAPPRPPPGMNDADVNALYATYVKAKKAVGEEAGPGSYGKLLQTINAQAPKIMEQYKAKGVEFSVVVKDNQVVLKAKPKT